MNVSTQYDWIRCQIREDIVTMHLCPGTLLHAKELQRSLNVGLMPIRNALIQLQVEGLVNILPQSRSFVSYLNYNQLEQSAFIIEQLNKAVLSVLLMQPEILLDDQVKQTIALTRYYSQITDVFNFAKQASEFWRLLYQSAKKLSAWEWLQPIWQRVSWLQMHNIVSSSSYSRVITEQEELLKAIRTKSAPEIDEIVSFQIQRICVGIKYYLDYS
ncbi:GntR family transcriptional regulator [Lacticaseibacillus sp. GG6-2]